MATRSKIHFAENGKTFVTIYRHWDGYPSAAGVEIAKFLNGMTMVNGLSSTETLFQYANGIGCLAAQFIALFKTSPGNYYIVAKDSDCGQEFVYTIDLSNGVLSLKVRDVYSNKTTTHTDFEAAINVFENDKI